MRVDLARAVMGVMAMATLLGGCGSWCRRPASHATTEPAADLRPSEPGSSFVLGGPLLGGREVRPSRCIAGGHYQFLGADLVDETHALVVRTVVDPIEGTVVRVFDAEDPDRATVVVRRRDCRKLVAELASTGSWVNGINELSLDLALDCRTAAGDSIAGGYSAAACR